MDTRRRRIELVSHALGLHGVATKLFRATPLGRRQMENKRRLHAFYRPLLSGHRLAFDIGANHGHFASVLSDLGLQVIAIEPNLDCVRHIRISYPSVEVIQAVAGDANGMVAVNISDQRDDVSSISEEWMESMRAQIPGYYDWNRKVSVPMLTLDSLISHYGIPDYIKIDVEGSEEKVLAGLSQCPQLLSFEYHVAFMDSSLRCIRAEIFQGARFNFTTEEAGDFALSSWCSASDLQHELLRMGRSGYGDIYVRRD